MKNSRGQKYLYNYSIKSMTVSIHRSCGWWHNGDIVVVLIKLVHMHMYKVTWNKKTLSILYNGCVRDVHSVTQHRYQLFCSIIMNKWISKLDNYPTDGLKYLCTGALHNVTNINIFFLYYAVLFQIFIRKCFFLSICVYV